MNKDEEMVNTVRRSPRRMDFAPRPRGNSAPVSPVKRVVKTPQMTEAEERRREIARREVARREEIHRRTGPACRAPLRARNQHRVKRPQTLG